MRALVSFAILVLVAVPVGAEHCETYDTSPAEFSTENPTGLAVYYVDHDLFCSMCVFSIWIYEETNGIPGLQRGDEQVDDTCHGSIQADTVVA